eukprot:187811-Prymnesium_polylepis.1
MSYSGRRAALTHGPNPRAASWEARSRRSPTGKRTRGCPRRCTPQLALTPKHGLEAKRHLLALADGSGRMVERSRQHPIQLTASRGGTRLLVP